MKTTHHFLSSAALVIAALAALFFLTACSRNSSPPSTQDEIAAPTIEWVLNESDRAGLGNQRLRKLLAFVDSLAPEKLESTIDQLMGAQANGRYLQATQMLYARWWRLDPHQALQHALKQSGDEQSSALGHILPLWAASEPREAWQWFETNGADLPANTAHAILREIVRDDPPLALKLYDESEVLTNSLQDPNPAFLYGTWANYDPAAAAAHLDANNMPALKRAIVSFNIVSAWIRSDADAAWNWVQTIEPAPARLRAMEQFVTLLSLRNLEKAETLLEEFPAGKARKSATSSLVGTLYMKDPVKAFTILQKHGGGRIEASILGHWALRDTDTALEVAKNQLPIGPRQKNALNEIIGTVARRDIEKAIRILEEFGSDSDLTHGARILAGQYAEQDLENARQWAENLPDGGIKSAAISELLSKWIDRDAPEAAQYALDQAASAPSANLLGNALRGWSYLDPKSCAEWILANLDASQQQINLPTPISQWAEHEPDAASAWVANLPSGDVYDACIARLASQWGYYHPEAGAKWLETLKPGKSRDAAIEDYVSRAFDYLPEEALRWSTQIEDPQRKSSTAQQLTRKYLRRAPEKARAWIQSSSLAEESKEALLRE